jgi:hypothetical protein
MKIDDSPYVLDSTDLDKIPDDPQIGGGVSGAVNSNQGDFV